MGAPIRARWAQTQEALNDALDADEHALVLFSRMLSRRPVWVDSPANQMTWVQMIGLDDDGTVIVYDHEGSDRPATDYMLIARAEGRLSHD